MAIPEDPRVPSSPINFPARTESDPGGAELGRQGDTRRRWERSQARGARAEAAVAQWLEARGYDVVAQNLRLGHLEVDLVVRQGDMVAIVEVRTRGAGSFTSAFGSIDSSKRRYLRRAAARLWAKYYRHDPTVNRLRIDAAAVSFHGDGPVVEYCPGAL